MLSPKRVAFAALVLLAAGCCCPVPSGKMHPGATAACSRSLTSKSCTSCCTRNGANGSTWSSGSGCGCVQISVR